MSISEILNARGRHQKILKGTSSANIWEDDATTEGVTIINYISRRCWELYREMRNQWDWFAIGTWCQETPRRSDWTTETRLAINVFHLEDDWFSYNGGVHPAVTLEILKLERWNELSEREAMQRITRGTLIILRGATFDLAVKKKDNWVVCFNDTKVYYCEDNLTKAAVNVSENP